MEIIKSTILAKNIDLPINLSGHPISDNKDEKIEESKDLKEKPTINFGEVLSKQVDSFVNQIKHNISDLAKSEIRKDDQKNLYKVKKSLEFDIKDLLNIQSMLDEINSDHLSEKNSQGKVQGSNLKSEFQKEEKSSYKVNSDDETESESFLKNNQLVGEKTDKNIALNEQLDKLQSIQEVLKFAGNFITKFEDFHNILLNEEKFPKEEKNIRKKVSPSKIISQEDLENDTK